ncbi:hypothetical protein BDN67DRAFT_1066260 [Paxillus ammoniavirescens]|nr:hypothetical protein BDN67DRAFT_1066260 [Paxillus ammoniavirescens]
MHCNQDHSYHTENHGSQKKRQSKVERIRNALAIVRDGKIEPDFEPLRERIKSIPHDDNSPSELYQLFDLIFNDSRGGPLFHRWIEDQAVDVVQRKVYDEMDDVKDALRGTINSITPEFLMTWDINSTMDRIVDESAPTLHRLLESVSQKTSTTACNVIVAQLANHWQRSHHSLYLAAPFTITLVEDILGDLVMVFRGAGPNNYCAAILRFIFNLKRVWTPKFANIMRDNMLVNLTGLEGRFMPIDLNIEHLIIFLKHVREQVGRALGIAYRGITHTTPDNSASISKVAHKVNDLALHRFNLDRDGNSSTKPVINTLASGEQKLKSSTLATFNKR